jgi:hypothetical protein
MNTGTQSKQRVTENKPARHPQECANSAGKTGKYGKSQSTQDQIETNDGQGLIAG